MTDSGTRMRLHQFLDARRSPAGGDVLRRQRIREYFATGSGALPEPLGIVLQWARRNASRIDVLMLWGSYVRGDETEQSFFLPHGRGDAAETLLCGPSDLDGLLVTTRSLPLPEILRTYEAFDRRLVPKGTMSLNLFRDLIQLPRSALLASLTERSQSHRSCILNARAAGGVVLCTTAEAEEIFDRFAGEADHGCVSRQSMEARFARLEEFLRLSA